MHALGNGQGEGVDFTTTNDHQVIAGCLSERGIDGFDADLSRIRRIGLARQHQVAAPGQSAADGNGGLAPHQHGLAEGELLEALEIVGQVPGHGAVAANGEVAVECRDQCNHTATGALIGLSAL